MAPASRRRCATARWCSWTAAAPSHGYQSDISRSFVFGEANAEQRKVWQQVRQGQQIAIETARVGCAAGAVDDAVRAQYEKWG